MINLTLRVILLIMTGIFTIFIVATLFVVLMNIQEHLYSLGFITVHPTLYYVTMFTINLIIGSTITNKIVDDVDNLIQRFLNKTTNNND